MFKLYFVTFMRLVYNGLDKKSMDQTYVIQKVGLCNMKRIKQINESKQLIFEGFMRLLEYNDYEEIRISEIVKEAGVVRMTLYRHFKEKEDIIIFAFEQSFNKAIKIVEQTENSSIIDLLIFRFSTLKESPYTNILAKHNKLNKLFQTIGKEFAHHFRALLPEIDDMYNRTFLVGGIDAMTELWIQEGMKESPENMAKKVLMIFNLFNKPNNMTDI